MRSLYTIFVFSVFIGSVSSSVLGADLTDNQMKMFCKLVDPTFLNRLPVIMEIKAAGATQWGATLKYARDGSGGQELSFVLELYMNQMRLQLMRQSRLLNSHASRDCKKTMDNARCRGPRCKMKGQVLH